MLLVSIALIALVASSMETPMSYLVSIDGDQIGAFSQMKTENRGDDRSVADPASAGTIAIELENGWLNRSSLELWFEADSIDAKAPVFSDPSLETRARRTVTIEQIIGSGPRGRTRSWTLLEACPSQLKVDKLDETQRLWLTSITFVARDIAAAR